MKNPGGEGHPGFDSVLKLKKKLLLLRLLGFLGALLGGLLSSFLSSHSSLHKSIGFVLPHNAGH
jgi:hypothetical protein